jgi:hypothetical protein
MLPGGTPDLKLMPSRLVTLAIVEARAPLQLPYVCAQLRRFKTQAR